MSPREALRGLGTLVRADLRRDRVMIPLWAAGIALLYGSQGPAIDGLYATQEEFDAAAAAMGANSAFVAMAGPARALNTIGGQVTWQATAFGALAADLMSALVVLRHTRAEEEQGRDELVRAAAVGRWAPPAAALAVAVGANVLAGVLVALSLVVFPLAVADSVALGAGLALTGSAFAALALVAAQLTTSNRAAGGLVAVVLGASYALRAVGDVGGGTLSWFSPIGWYQATHAFSGLRWWPLLLTVGLLVLAVVASAALLERRDIGSGLWATRPGSARAGRTLAGPVGLAWRLQRGGVLAWCAGLFLTGLSYGSIGDDVDSLLGEGGASSEMMTQGLGVATPEALTDAFYATSLVMMALIGAGFAVSSALRLRGEETAGRAETLLAAGLSRGRWAGASVLVTVLGTLAVVVAGGLGIGIGYALVTGEAGAWAQYVLPALVPGAGVLLLAGLARLVLGVLPRRSGLAWAPLGLAVVVLFFGELLRLPGWLTALSPFDHLPLVPAESFDAAPVVVVLGLAALASAAGQLAFRRRDVG
ncbi:ABC transporter permease [Nocardioides bruguierae]|uniref:ABC transporter permease n=1 Tax=Nocardioides bruguierae TaxID=2945102 RepID=A0A9X2ID58_9ACTN|nr:hypothetical protein [Nocardioides bruguierae]MCM0618922.1 hypothetical protein [Nocardioides bruguierae]